MTNMNGKIFVNKYTDGKCIVLNEALNATQDAFTDYFVYAFIDNEDDTWYLMEYSEFMSDFTEVERNGI